MNIDLANVPPVPIQIGVAGENAFRTITFDASTWGADFPDATYTVVYKRSDGYIYPVLVNAAADAIVWSPTDTDTAVSGNGQIEVRLLDDETIGKTIVMQTFVAPSLSGDESEPSTPAPDWVNDVAADADRAEAAVEHYPQIRNGELWVWNINTEQWEKLDVSGGSDSIVYVTEADSLHVSMSASEIQSAVSSGKFPVLKIGNLLIPFCTMTDDGDAAFSVTTADNSTLSAVTILVDDNRNMSINNATSVQSVNGMTGAVTLSASDVGAYVKPSGGIPASDLASAVQTSLGKADSAYQKPSGGIPTSDLASGVIPSVPQMATQGDMSDWTSGKTVDADVLKNGVQYIERMIIEKPDASDIPTAVSELTNDSGYQTAQDVQTAIAAAAELPTVTASDNGKFLRVVSGAWAAETVQTWQGGSY